MSRDPLELLRSSLPPIAHVDPRPAAAEAMLAAIIDTAVVDTRLTDRPSAAASRQRRRRWRWPAICVVVAVSAGATGYAVLRSEQVSNPSGVQCFEHVSLDSPSAVVAFTSDPVAACVAAWQRGELEGQLPPALTACVRETGVAVVVPGDAAACGTVGLPAFEPGLAPPVDAEEALLERLVDLNSVGCRSEEEGLALAAEVLGESTLEGWTSQLAEPFPPGRPCARLGLDREGKVLLVFGGLP